MSSDNPQHRRRITLALEVSTTVIPLLRTDRLGPLLRALGPAIGPSPRWVRARYDADSRSLARAYLAHGVRLVAVLSRAGPRGRS
jgi:hypothetical protein